MIASSSLQNTEHLAREFAGNKPFRHVVVPEFFSGDVCARIVEDFPAYHERYALDEMGQVGGKAVRMDFRDISPVFRELDGWFSSQTFLDTVSRITGIPDLLYDPDYIGGGTHENRNGQGLDTHVDFNYHPRTGWHRRLNLIVYLNPEWQEGWGGQLQLHSNPWDEESNRTVSILPLLNRCVIFETTEDSWHGFPAINLPDDAGDISRKSIAIYLYTRERPDAETAPPHATVYVPDTMPSHFAPGYTLSEDDVRDLRRRFTRVKSQLRFLYEREKEFGSQLRAGAAALDEARAALRMNLQGLAMQPGGTRGLWPDDWVGRELSTRFIPGKNARALVLRVWAPPHVGKDQQLSIDLGGTVQEATLRPGASTKIRIDARMRANREVSLRIDSGWTWRPGGDSGGDQRELAFKLLDAELVH